MTTSMKQAIRSIEPLLEKRSLATFLEVFRPWLTLTDLGILDVLHLPHGILRDKLELVHSELSKILDVLTEEQAQEAAARLLAPITVYASVTDLFDARPSGSSLVWDGANWLFVCDPRTRLRDTRATYREALAEVRRHLGHGSE